MSISAFADGSGSLQFSVSRGGSSEDEQDLDSYSWPDELPPFCGSHIPNRSSRAGVGEDPRPRRSVGSSRRAGRSGRNPIGQE